MEKLIKGIVEFRKNVLPQYKETFRKLALGQSPDTLFIACSDSRVVPNLFASTDPGDLFVVRNVGNIIPPYVASKTPTSSLQAEAAALQFSLENLQVKDIIVCGHSECGAINVLLAREKGKFIKEDFIGSWLNHIHPCLDKHKEEEPINPLLPFHNQLSQINVLLQLEHLQTYPIVQERIKKGTLKLHGWWFDIGKADVYAFDDISKTFILITENTADKIISLNNTSKK